MSCTFLHDTTGFFKNYTLKALNISFKKVVLPGRVKCGGTEREIVVAHGCWKRKKLICGTEGEIVVAYGRLPSPARLDAKAENNIALKLQFYKKIHFQIFENKYYGLK